MSDKVKHISEETLDLLTQAAAWAEGEIASGVDPKTAFMQAAKEFDLTPQQTKLLIRGWNITNFTEKFGSSRKLEDRCSEVPVLHFDEFEKLLNAGAKTAAANNGSVWYGYDVPPEVRIKRAYQKDPLKKYESVLATDEFFFKVAGAENFVKRNFNKLIDLRRQAYDAFTSLVSEFQIKLGELKSAIKVSGIPKDVLVGNLNVVNPLSARIVSHVLKETKCANLVRNRIDYSFDEKQEPYKTALKCAALMVSIDDKKKLLNKLDDLWDGYKFDDRVIKKQAEWAVESMEISPLVGGVYSKRRWGYFNDNVLDVEDPDFFVLSGNSPEESSGVLKTASDEEDSDSKPSEFDENKALEAALLEHIGYPGSTNPKALFSKNYESTPERDKLEEEIIRKSIEAFEAQRREIERRQEREEELHERRMEELRRRDGEYHSRKEQYSKNREDARLQAGRRAFLKSLEQLIGLGSVRNSYADSPARNTHFSGLSDDNRPQFFKELEDSINKIQEVERRGDVAESVHFIKSLRYAVEFMSKDPVIREYGLEAVFNAVFTLRTLSPMLADNSILLFNMTRKFLEQGGILDLNEIVGLARLSPSKA